MVGGERTTCASTASSLKLRRANARRPLTHSLTQKSAAKSTDNVIQSFPSPFVEFSGCWNILPVGGPTKSAAAGPPVTVVVTVQRVTAAERMLPSLALFSLAS